MSHIAAFFSLVWHGNPTALLLLGFLGFCVSAWVAFVFGGILRAVRIATTWVNVVDHPPRTPLGKQLAGSRSRIVASGARLLDWDALDREVAERRGERHEP